ncbi:MAG: transporter, family, nitrate/nitrite transporter [Campylobacterota bacterium]|nr:transporter, family, nitrate/nitrite transporter [Campylobacterota bacterium]
MAINIEKWDVEDNGFWEREGKAVANRNLWISIPALLLAFAVWIIWGMLIVKMKELGFTLGMNPQTPEDWAKVNAMLWALPAIAGLAGATLRIPNSFMIAVGGGRNVTFLNTLFLAIPAFGAGIALQDKDTPYAVFVVLALTSGFGGGNFSSSMSNISYFFPKRMQGTALGLNAGLGNLGVSTMQFLVPFMLTGAIFGTAFGAAQVVPGTEKLIYLHNGAFVWVPLIILASLAAFFGMNNLKSATPNLGNYAGEFTKIILLTIFGLVGSAIAVYMLVFLKINMWIVLPVAIIVTLAMMKYLSPGELKGSINKQFAIFSNKHTWIMTVLYIMTFGSFIGYASSFPKLIQDIFGYIPNPEVIGEMMVNPHAPNPMTYAFLGPLLGALIRPVGGWLSDKLNSGSRVTAWSTILQIVSALAAAYFIVESKGSATPQDNWWPFFWSFMALFAGTGIGNGSTFRSVPYIFSKEQAGPVLGWTAAAAAYGAFIVPKIFGEQIAAKTPENALYGFVAFYVFCLVLNWWYYDRKNAEVKC